MRIPREDDTERESIQSVLRTQEFLDSGETPVKAQSTPGFPLSGQTQGSTSLSGRLAVHGGAVGVRGTLNPRPYTPNPRGTAGWCTPASRFPLVFAPFHRIGSSTGRPVGF